MAGLCKRCMSAMHGDRTTMLDKPIRRCKNSRTKKPRLILSVRLLSHVKSWQTLQSCRQPV